VTSVHLLAGVIQGTASEACLVAVLAGKSRKMQGRAPEDALKLVAYSSDQAHSCVKKACMVAGVNHCRLLSAKRDPPPPAQRCWFVGHPSFSFCQPVVHHTVLCISSDPPHICSHLKINGAIETSFGVQAPYCP